MKKTIETIKEAVTNPKFLFKKVDGHPQKAVKHRYERRKVKEFLHIEDWRTEEAV